MSDSEAKEFIKNFTKDRIRSKANYHQPVIENQKTFVKVAETILFSRFGVDNIEDQRPYTIGYTDGYYIMYGTLHTSHGGVFHIIIDEANGEVVNVWHDK